MENLPEDVNALFRNPDPVKEVHEMALGGNGSFAAVYTNSKGGMMLSRSNLPASLESWLVPVKGKGVGANRDLSTMQISLGPGGSYFAFDKNGASWGSLPDGLDKAINERRDSNGRFLKGWYPSSVSLSVNGSYVFLSAGGGALWALDDASETLKTLLHTSNDKEKMVRSWNSVLFPVSLLFHIILTYN